MVKWRRRGPPFPGSCLLWPDANPMGVARQVSQHLLRAGKRALAIDHPPLAGGFPDELLELRSAGQGGDPTVLPQRIEQGDAPPLSPGTKSPSAGIFIMFTLGVQSYTYRVRFPRRCGAVSTGAPVFETRSPCRGACVADMRSQSDVCGAPAGQIQAVARCGVGSSECGMSRAEEEP
jgi:hypothetical protein